MGNLSTPFRPEYKIPCYFILSRRTAKHGKPVLVVSLEFPDDGRQRVYCGSAQPSRGSGIGQDWLEQISTDYGGLNIQDYLTAIDDVAREPFVDKEHLGAVGASYGGFSVNYLAGHHEKRFKAFISHCGIFNFEQQYLTTDEMWFENWDMGGSYWNKINDAAQRSFSFSPHLYVEKWDTPMLIIHGGKDFRIPYTQGMAAFNAAVIQNIPAQFLYFPKKAIGYKVRKNGILWQRVFKQWLDKWLK